jgi:hypothetical protein
MLTECANGNIRALYLADVYILVYIHVYIYRFLIDSGKCPVFKSVGTTARRQIIVGQYFDQYSTNIWPIHHILAGANSPQSPVTWVGPGRFRSTFGKC